MINLKNQKEINIMREAGHILGTVLKAVVAAVRPGIKTIELDSLARELILKYGASPSFKNYRSYPHNICVSINEEVVHGLPSERIIKDGDLVGVDIGVYYKGFHTDSAITVGVGRISRGAQKLINATKAALSLAISMSADGICLLEIQKGIQGLAEKSHLTVIRDLCGHGVGKALQEKPDVPNFPDYATTLILKKGMTLAYEPMFSLGSGEVMTKDDGWTIITADKSLSCQFEHTVAITENGCEVLTK